MVVFFFSTNYYHFVTQLGLKLRRYWLFHSSCINRFYCQPSWLFSHENVSPETSYALQNPWGTAGLNDWRHLFSRIRSHERSTHYVESCVIYEQWRNRGTIEEALHASSLKKHKLLAKCFGKTSECYVDVSKVQPTFL